MTDEVLRYPMPARKFWAAAAVVFLTLAVLRLSNGGFTLGLVFTLLGIAACVFNATARTTVTSSEIRLASLRPRRYPVADIAALEDGGKDGTAVWFRLRAGQRVLLVNAKPDDLGDVKRVTRLPTERVAAR